MASSRLEAFRVGVMAVIITSMALGQKLLWERVCMIFVLSCLTP